MPGLAPGTTCKLIQALYSSVKQADTQSRYDNYYTTQTRRKNDVGSGYIGFVGDGATYGPNKQLYLVHQTCKGTLTQGQGLCPQL